MSIVFVIIIVVSIACLLHSCFIYYILVQTETIETVESIEIETVEPIELTNSIKTIYHNKQQPKPLGIALDPIVQKLSLRISNLHYNT